MTNKGSYFKKVPLDLFDYAKLWEDFEYLAVYMYLKGKAQWKEKDVNYKGDWVLLYPDEIITTAHYISKDLKIDRSKVRRILNRFEKDGRLKLINRDDVQIYQLLDFDPNVTEYFEGDQTSDHFSGDQSDHSTNQEIDHLRDHSPDHSSDQLSMFAQRGTPTVSENEYFESDHSSDHSIDQTSDQNNNKLSDQNNNKLSDHSIDQSRPKNRPLFEQNPKPKRHDEAQGVRDFQRQVKKTESDHFSDQNTLEVKEIKKEVFNKTSKKGKQKKSDSEYFETFALQFIQHKQLDDKQHDRSKSSVKMYRYARDLESLLDDTFTKDDLELVYLYLQANTDEFARYNEPIDFKKDRSKLLNDALLWKKENAKPAKKEARVYEHDSDPYQFTLHFLKTIKTVDPDLNAPREDTLQGWANIARLLNERDGRSWDDIYFTCDTYIETWWRDKIFNMKAFRAKFPMLLNQSKSWKEQSHGKESKEGLSDTTTDEIDDFFNYLEGQGGQPDGNN